MRRGLQILLVSFGVVAIFISFLHIALGPKCIPGSVPVNATMDSEDRFYATLFLAYGFALLWCVKGIERKGAYVNLLAMIFFVGGLARIISILAVGLPNRFFIAMTILELLLPLVIVPMNARVSSATGRNSAVVTVVNSNAD
jgi:hypothetical protein